MVNYVQEMAYWAPTVLLIVSILLLIIIAVGLSYGIFWKGVASWSWRQIFSLVRLSAHEYSFRASMDAEESVEAALRDAGWRHVFLRRRVPVQRLSHNREIDVVAVGPVILVVEVKHWRGFVWCNGQRWYHQGRKEGQTLEFEDVLEDNLVKATALRRYIENDKRIPLPDFEVATADLRDEEDRGTWYKDPRLHKLSGKLVVPVVVFTNKMVKLDPKTVKRKENVFDMPGFKKYARELIQSTRGTSPISLYKLRFIEFVGRQLFHQNYNPSGCYLSLRDEMRVATAVRTMRTWDMVILLNGKLYHGDIVKIELESIKKRFERKQIADMEVLWFTGLFGFLKTLWLNTNGIIKIKFVDPKAGTITVSQAMRKMKRSCNGNKLFLKLAGSVEIVSIILTDVASVQLSRHEHGV
uniref:NERD domain-containing protein n=1 Tax=Trypanosoma congolense (strain IL3000) TaxID=1068625 RepID=G0UXA5_TRYCI|nr:conserved hypothetical protein [Trypanosoma congolense IL3000]